MDANISIACHVSKGIFMSDCSVRIIYQDQILWEGLVDRGMMVNLDEHQLSESKYLPARVYAYLVSFSSADGTAIIELPVENSASGRRLIVPIDIVRAERQPA